jgi:hypothetical protein|tara:strand:- start:977 stop:1144 length:168 start_codon:yes stop_codon:yes gene_type:complete
LKPLNALAVGIVSHDIANVASSNDPISTESMRSSSVNFIANSEFTSATWPMTIPR